MINGAVLYTIAIILTSISFIKNPNKTKDALLKSWKMFRTILPDILAIMLFVGLSLSILTPSLISSIIGENSGWTGIVYSTIIGSIALIPSFVVFPLGGDISPKWSRSPSSSCVNVYINVSRNHVFTYGTKNIWAKFCLFPQCICNFHVAHIFIYYLGGDGMNELKKYRFFFILLFGIIILTFINQSVGWKAFQLTGKSMIDMLFLLPPVLLFVGLLDKWVEKETLIRYMGKKSGIYGTLFSLLLGVIAAGPLYVAFPIAALLLKKGASIRYIVFFLGVWTTAKLPVVVYEVASFGLKFTLIHICFGLLFFYLMGIIYEKFYDQRQLLKYDITKDV